MPVITQVRTRKTRVRAGDTDMARWERERWSQTVVTSVPS
jgi:hypothetical protein